MHIPAEEENATQCRVQRACVLEVTLREFGGWWSGAMPASGLPMAILALGHALLSGELPVSRRVILFTGWASAGGSYRRRCHTKSNGEHREGLTHGRGGQGHAGVEQHLGMG